MATRRIEEAHAGCAPVCKAYVEARREWDERYADLALGERNWHMAAGGLLAATLILASGIVRQATRTRYI